MPVKQTTNCRLPIDFYDSCRAKEFVAFLFLFVRLNLCCNLLLFLLSNHFLIFFSFVNCGIFYIFSNRKFVTNLTIQINYTENGMQIGVILNLCFEGSGIAFTSCFFFLCFGILLKSYREFHKLVT